MNNLTLLETILITYILLNWFLMIMLAILPKRVINKVFLLFYIICPPLIIGGISEQIKLKHNERKENVRKRVRKRQ